MDYFLSFTLCFAHVICINRQKKQNWISFPHFCTSMRAADDGWKQKTKHNTKPKLYFFLQCGCGFRVNFFSKVDDTHKKRKKTDKNVREKQKKKKTFYWKHKRIETNICLMCEERRNLNGNWHKNGLKNGTAKKKVSLDHRRSRVQSSFYLSSFFWNKNDLHFNINECMKRRVGRVRAAYIYEQFITYLFIINLQWE